MEFPVDFVLDRLTKLPNQAFVNSDASAVYANVKGELVIIEGKPGDFNMTEHELAAFIRRNANKKGTKDKPE